MTLQYAAQLGRCRAIIRQARVAIGRLVLASSLYLRRRLPVTILKETGTSTSIS